jgi:hypothetical protein
VKGKGMEVRRRRRRRRRRVWKMQIHEVGMVNG